MTNKLVTVCKAKGLKPTPTIRELAACFDPLMPMIKVGGGAVIGPASLLAAATFMAEDNSGPLYILRPPSLFAAQMVVSMTLACTQLSLLYLASAPAFVAPDPTVAAGIWATTPAGLVTTPSAIKFAEVMGQYLSDAFNDGSGVETDAPPPPYSLASLLGQPVAPAPTINPLFTDLIAYEDGPDGFDHSIYLYPNVRDAYFRLPNETEPFGKSTLVSVVDQKDFIIAWSANRVSDGSDVTSCFHPDNLQSRPSFIFDDSGFAVNFSCTVLNSQGQLSETRTDVFLP